MLDLFAYLIVRGIIGTLNALPLNARLIFLASFFRYGTYLVPSIRKVSRKNLELVFPNMSPKEREDILNRSFDSLARLFVDFARLEMLDEAWLASHVRCDYLPRYKELKKSEPGKGIVIATGHLGSFELLAHAVATWGYPLSFIVRNFKLPRLDRWWTGIREAKGNKVIPRKGAVKQMLQCLNQGMDTALLFDQNVTRNHAVFVDWFGKPAATTMTVGLAAVRTKARVIVASIFHEDDDNYRVDAVELNFDDLYRDESLSPDEKITRITADAAKEYEKMILRKPESWFWMHRRWKTQPEGTEESFY